MLPRGSASSGGVVVCYSQHMRLHIEMTDALVRRIDQRAGRRRRSRFIRDAVVAALTHEARWEVILSTAGAIEDAGHPWAEDPAAWGRRQRRGGGEPGGE